MVMNINDSRLQRNYVETVSLGDVTQSRKEQERHSRGCDLG